MDSASNADWIKDRKAKELSLAEQEIPDLKKFSVELQQRIAQAEDDSPLYFRLEDIQLLLGGLAMSQLHIFQGISGTGKTSLAKAFAKAVGGHCTDIAVQAGWRDRDDLLGHYNAFEKRFYERDCLQGLYTAQTSAYKDRCNIIFFLFRKMQRFINRIGKEPVIFNCYGKRMFIQKIKRPRFHFVT